jgi:6-pyruvoyltetrahydropterin/6-carboxytetrahydropterin synthase
MFKISVQRQFVARHQLNLPDGSTERAHEHNWLITAELSRAKLSQAGFVMNFEDLKELLEEITAEFENKSLNEHNYFRQNNPSAEQVAKYIYDKLAAVLPAEVKLEFIEVQEQPGCRAKYHQK